MLLWGMAGMGEARALSLTHKTHNYYVYNHLAREHHRHPRLVLRGHRHRHSVNSHRHRYVVPIIQKFLHYDEYGNTPVLSGCRTAYRIIHQGYGRRVKVRGLLCYDVYGRSYLVPNHGRYVTGRGRTRITIH